MTDYLPCILLLPLLVIAESLALVRCPVLAAVQLNVTLRII